MHNNRNTWNAPPKEDPFAFGRRLTAAIHAKGWTQLDLASAIGCDPKLITVWNNGKAKPSYKYLREAAGALEVSADYLLGLTGPNPAMTTEVEP